MEVQPKVHFDDTAVAFSYKSDRDLRKANLIFTVVNHPFISNLATRAVKAAIGLHLPVKGLIKKTVFEHFCGGETIRQSEVMIQKLAGFQVGTILDYSVEGAKTEAGFDATAQEILNTFDEAASNSSVPFCVFKVTGMADMELLEKAGNTNEILSPEERAAFDRVRERVDRICARAFASGVPVLIDAEDSWIQDTIDSLAYVMMRQYNKDKAIVFNTFQMYRADMLGNLEAAYRDASEKGYRLGVKLVRGAYMEKERKRAETLGYPDPINPDKAATDEMFNKGLSFCIDKPLISLVCGTHNEYSNHFLTVLMEKHGLMPGNERVWFAQLLGMSDNISFNLAKAGYRVAKYVPYGPVEAVMPYLLRRAAENTSVAGQSSRELILIRRELMRRKAEQ